MSSHRILHALTVVLVIVACLYLAAGVLYWDWALLPGANHWVYTPRAWWPLAVLASLLACMVLVLLRKQNELETRLAELERRQRSAGPVAPPSSKPSSTAFTE
jgi:hypothetical protein